jgi:adenylate cyclase
LKISQKPFPMRFCLILSVLSVLAYVPFLVGIESNGVFVHMERVWHDLSFPLRGEALKTGDDRLILVAVDEEAVHKHGFPLPRDKYAEALNRLTALGAKTVIFDVLFFEPSPGDAGLAAATRKHGGVIHLFTAEPPPEGKKEPKIQMPIEPFRKAAKMLASPIISHHLEDDGHVRTFSLFNPFVKDPIRPNMGAVSLAAGALSLYTGTSLQDLLAQYPAEEYVYPVINFRRPRDWVRHPTAKDPGEPVSSPYRVISILDVLANALSDVQKKALKGAIVIIGSTTTGYYDHYPNPFSGAAPGAEVHLNAIDNVLNKDPLQSTSRGWVIVLILVSAWLPYLFHRVMSPALGAAATAGILALMVGGSLWLMAHGTVVYPVAPAIILIISFLVLTVHRVLTEGAEKALIKAKFGQFVSPEIVEELANDPDKAKLGAQKREMTVFFLDIAHFTTISEKMDAEALIGFLNKYLSALSVVILDRRGTIDKFIGDCIMAFWNAPLENKNHAADAVLSALRCQVAIAELNKNLDKGLPETPQVRIGINTGHMAVGFTGTEKKLAYTVLGDEVNLASRLEGANKFFGSKIMVSEATWNGAKDAAEGRYLGRARVVGKETPVPVYEPLAEKGKLDAAWLKALPVWEKGIKAFYAKDYDKALAAFEEFAKLMPGDGPGELYLHQSRDYAALPPEDWDQVFNLTAK